MIRLLRRGGYGTLVTVQDSDRKISRRSFALAGFGVVSAAASGAVAKSLVRPSWQDAYWLGRGLALVSRNDDEATFAVSGRGQIVVNPSGAYLLERCDGRHTGEDLVRVLMTYGDLDYGTATQDVETFLVATVREGLVGRA